jgi:hypothetical protein
MHRCSLPLRLISINCLHVGQSRHETSFPHLLQTLLGVISSIDLRPSSLIPVTISFSRTVVGTDRVSADWLAARCSSSGTHFSQLGSPPDHRTLPGRTGKVAPVQRPWRQKPEL